MKPWLHASYALQLLFWLALAVIDAVAWRGWSHAVLEASCVCFVALLWGLSIENARLLTLLRGHAAALSILLRKDTQS